MSTKYVLSFTSKILFLKAWVIISSPWWLTLAKIEPYRKSNLPKIKIFSFAITLEQSKFCYGLLNLSQVECHLIVSWLEKVERSLPVHILSLLSFLKEATQTTIYWLIYKNEKLAKPLFIQVIFERDFVLEIYIRSTKQEWN